METKSLFQIEQEFLLLNEQIQQEEGILTEETIEALKINHSELQRKAVGYVFVIKKNDAECMIIDQEIKRLQGLKKVRENANERLKEAVKTAMNLYEIPEIKTELIKINFRKSVETIIDDKELIPSEFIKVEVVKTPDKTAIKKSIQEGKVIEGAHLQENKSIQIR